jgi:hypothetical protein
VYRILVGKPEGKKPLERSRRRCENNTRIKMHFRETVWCVMDWIHLAREKYQWWAVVNTVMNLRFL